MPNTTWLCISKCTGSVCICIPRTKKNQGVDSHFDCFYQFMIVLPLKWTFWRSQSLPMVSSHRHRISTKKHVVMAMNWFSVMHWAKQPCDCLIADIEKQGKQQEHATIAMDAALCSGSPALYQLKRNLHCELNDSFNTLSKVFSIWRTVTNSGKKPQPFSDK